jgi:serine/threonine protein kinase
VSRSTAVTSRRLATRRHNSDKGDARSETPPEPDSWDELAKRVGVKGALYLHDPAVFSRIEIGRFEAQVKIGRGGFGMVFKAFDPKLQRWVALKLCLTRSQTAIDDLMHEAQVLAALDHPNIVAILEPPGEYEGSAFFVMPYIDGENVREFAKGKPRPTWWEILDVFIDVASGLEAAHGARPPIIHGDVKPSNMLVDRKGFARIADFGLARRLIEDADESEQEGLRHRAGTLYYMAPERLRGEPGDARSDQFSFCVALKETLDGGVLPFVGHTPAELLEDIEQTEVQFEDPSLPNRILAVLRIGLSADPRDRFPDMRTLRAELIRLRRSAPDESVLDEPPPPDDVGSDEPPPSHETTPDKPPTDAPPPPLGEGVPVPELAPLASGPPPSKAKGGTFAASLMLVGALCLVVGWVGGRVGGPHPSDPLSSTGELKQKRVPAHRAWIDGLKSYSDALQAIDRGDVQAGYDAWLAARIDVRHSTPRLDGEMSLLLAKRVDERNPGRPFAAWMANGAAESFEQAQSWRRAAEARQVAAGLARAANQEGQAAYQERCVLVNAMGRPCD